MAAGLAGVLRQRVTAAVGLAVMALGLALPLAGEFSTSSGRLAVTLLQGNIPQDEKFQRGSGIPLALEWYGRQLREATTALVVAPETAIPLLPTQLPEGYLAALSQRYSAGTQAALIGIPLAKNSQAQLQKLISYATARRLLPFYSIYTHVADA